MESKEATDARIQALDCDRQTEMQVRTRQSFATRLSLKAPLHRAHRRVLNTPVVTTRVAAQKPSTALDK